MNQAAIVHVIDDDSGVRKSLKMVLEASGLPVEVYESAEQFLEVGDADAGPGCIILDLRMPGMGGLELLRELRERRSEIPVIAISGHADVAAAVRSMKLGAIDHLQKPFEPKTLLSIVQKAIQDSIALQGRQAEMEGVRKRFEELTSRERDLLNLVVSGRSNKQIAKDMSISVKTVANHRAHLMAKTKAANAADLARLSVLADIVSPK